MEKISHNLTKWLINAGAITEKEEFMEYQLKRVLSEKKKVIMMILLIIVPSLEVLQIIYWNLKVGGDLPVDFPYPMYATFLSLYSEGHILQQIYLWFLPMYLLIISGEECIEDYKTGNKNILISRIGKKNYIKSKLKSGFLTSSGIVGIGLLINLIVVQFVYSGGTALRYDGEYMVYDKINMPNTFLFEWSYTHPLAANLSFIAITMLFAGLIGMIGTMLAIILHDRKLVYAITFALWFVPILFKNSFMLIFQPFSEYGLKTLLPLAIGIGGVYIMLIIILAIVEEKCIEI